MLVITTHQYQDKMIEDSLKWVLFHKSLLPSLENTGTDVEKISVIVQINMFLDIVRSQLFFNKREN